VAGQGRPAWGPTRSDTASAGTPASVRYRVKPDLSQSADSYKIVARLTPYTPIGVGKSGKFPKKLIQMISLQSGRLEAIQTAEI